VPDAFSLGPVALPPLLPGAVLSLLAGYFVLRFVLPRGGMIEQASWIRERLPTALMIGFLTWKLWPLLQWWESVIARPSILLRMPGGTAGAVAGLVLATAWLLPGLRAEKTRIRPLLMTTGVAATVFLFSLGVLQAIPGSTGRMEIFDDTVELPELEVLSVEGTTDLEDRYSIETLLRPGETPLVLTFWATWCAPCVAELPIKDEFYRRNSGSVRYVAVNLIRSESSRADVARFVRDNDMWYPVVLDSAGRLGTLFGVRGTPTTVVIDPSGTVAARWMGPSSLDRLERATRSAR
jgi:thiol-disulfide isomerase/thioredoxin